MAQHMPALFVGDTTDTLPCLRQDHWEQALAGYALEFVTSVDRVRERLTNGDIQVLVFNTHTEESGALDVLDDIEKDWPHLPVVVVAAPAGPREAPPSTCSGVHPVLIGPLADPQLLILAIQCAIGRKQSEMEWQAKLKTEKEQRRLDEALLEVGAALNSTLNYEDVLDLILDKMYLVIPHDAADITVVEAQRVRSLRWRGYAAFDAVDYIASLDFDIEKVRNFGVMRETKQPLAIPYVEAYEAWVVCPEVAWIKSYIGAPIIVEGTIIGFLNVNSCTPGFFDEASARLLQAFADWAAVAIHNARLYESAKLELAERKRTEMALQHRLMVEALIGTVSTRFIQVDLDTFDVEMEKTLGSVGDFMAVDRSYLFLFANDSSGDRADQYYDVERAYEWCLVGIQPSAQNLVGSPFSTGLPWMFQQLCDGEAIRVNAAVDVPATAEAEHKWMRRSQAKSIIVAPLMQGGQLKGGFGVSMVRLARRWTDGDLSLLRLVGEVLFNAVTRKQAEEALRSSEQRYRGLAHENAGLLAQASRDAETKSTLLKEVNHRVKNNLTGIIGLLYAEQLRGDAQKAESRHALLEEMTCRIQGMATIHSMLTASEWGPLELGELVERVIRATQNIVSRRRQVLVNVTACSATVTPDEAHSLSLVVNELTTNSLKYATDGEAAASIDVQITVEKQTIHLLYRDNGPGYPDAALAGDQESVGLYLVHNLIRRELGGMVELSSDGGAVASIKFPSRILRAAGAGDG